MIASTLKSLLFASICLGLLGCSHLFYHPDSVEYRQPKDFPFAVKEILIPRDQQTPIHAWLMNDGEKSKGLILHFHGNAQNLTAHSSFSDWLAAEGYTVLIFDYSGYGRTLGEPSQKVLIEDTRAVSRYLQANDKWSAKGLPIVVFAQSLGGAVAVTSLAEIPELAAKVDLLLVESSFDSYAAVANAKLRGNAVSWAFSPLAFLLVDDYRSPREAIEKLKMPKIIVHGNADGVVPFENGKALYEAARPPKEFWEIPFGNHTEAFISGSPYRRDLLERLRSLKPHSPSGGEFFLYANPKLR